MGFRSLKHSLARIMRNVGEPQAPPKDEYPIAYATEKACLDKVKIENCGLVRVVGWSTSTTVELPRCFVGREEIPLLQMFRAHRPDVARLHGLNELFSGTEFLYQLPRPISGKHVMKVVFKDRAVFEAPCAFQTGDPHYSGLLTTATVLHRDDIYRSGPPASEVSPEVVALCQNLPGPVLDFGCGTGALIRALRSQNVEAYGIEVEREEIVNGMLREVKDYIRLYDGRFPLPFADGEFNTVTAVEVIEHLNDFESALDEIARITSSLSVITVPDMSSVPLCYRDNVVPWHLLEGTHVNFFNQTSLEATLRRRFSSVQVSRIGQVWTNNTKWFVSLGAICRK